MGLFQRKDPETLGGLLAQFFATYFIFLGVFITLIVGGVGALVWFVIWCLKHYGVIG